MYVCMCISIYTSFDSWWFNLWHLIRFLWGAHASETTSLPAWPRGLWPRGLWRGAALRMTTVKHLLKIKGMIASYYFVPSFDRIYCNYHTNPQNGCFLLTVRMTLKLICNVTKPRYGFCWGSLSAQVLTPAPLSPKAGLQLDAHLINQWGFS